MAIKIIEEPDIHMTAGELSRYQEDYNRSMMYYAGPRPTLEEWIRAQRALDSQLFGPNAKIEYPGP